MILGEYWRLHDDEAVEKIDVVAVRLLTKSGARIEHDGLLDLLEGAGYRGPRCRPARVEPPERVENQQSRFEQRPILTNASMSSRLLRRFCKLDAAGEALLKQAMNELGLSARAHDKVLRIARTIADLEAAENVQAHHLAEAVRYRRLDRRL